MPDVFDRVESDKSSGGSGAGGDIFDRVGPPPKKTMMGRFGDLAKDTAGMAMAGPILGTSTGRAMLPGALKGAMSTVYEGGDLIRRGLGMKRPLTDPKLQQELTPQGTAEKVGRVGEQALEYLLPIPGGAKLKALKGIGGKLARVGAEATRGGVVAGIQSGGDPASIATGAAMGGAGGAAGELLPGLSKVIGDKSTRMYERALEPTTKANKVIARKVVPELISRRLSAWTHAGLVDKVEQGLNKATADLDEAIQQAAEESRMTHYPTGKSMDVNVPGKGTPPTTPSNPGTAIALRPTAVSRPTGNVGPRLPNTPIPPSAGASTGTERVLDTVQGRIPTDRIVRALGDYANSFVVDGVPINRTAYIQAKKVQSLIKQLGPNVSYESLLKTRRILDDAVSATKGFQLQPNSSSLVASQKEGANAIRRELSSQFPNLDRVNAEYSFWKATSGLLKDSTLRGVGSPPGLLERVVPAEVFIHGAPMKAMMVRGLFKLSHSTGFKTVSSIQLDKLSKLLMSDNTAEAVKFMGQLSRQTVMPNAPVPRP